eukprot:TRINITY_DN6267_c0_g1_i5.p1 TRINITY_DN6267_c0_g1~~TRINITY_DN6267_c0_g1_i5.p1  ORF type:complete len:178 (-),score=31.48 TRINITY_DN6267_c0_g1_i5:234-695(-)
MLGTVQLRSQSLTLLKQKNVTVKNFRRPCTIFNKLVLKPTGGTSGSPIDLSDGKLKIGAVAPADIVLDVATVSSSHAILEVSGASVTITDDTSTNGTFVDAQKLSPNKPQKLNVGSVVVFGDDQLAKFELIEEADPPPPPAAESAPPSETTTE